MPEGQSRNAPNMIRSGDPSMTVLSLFPDVEKGHPGHRSSPNAEGCARSATPPPSHADPRPATKIHPLRPVSGQERLRSDSTRAQGQNLEGRSFRAPESLLQSEHKRSTGQHRKGQSIVWWSVVKDMSIGLQPPERLVGMSAGIDKCPPAAETIRTDPIFCSSSRDVPLKLNSAPFFRRIRSRHRNGGSRVDAVAVRWLNGESGKRLRSAALRGSASAHGWRSAIPDMQSA